MRTAHVTHDQLSRLQQRGLSGGELVTVLDHVAACEECRALANGERPLSVAATTLFRSAFAGNHLTEDQITMWATGKLDHLSRETLGEHVTQCPQCRADLEDLADARKSVALPIRAHIQRAIAVSALAAACVALIFFVAGRTDAPPGAPSASRVSITAPPQVAPRYAPEVVTALKDGRIDPPAKWRDLQLDPVVFRGSGGSSLSELEPYREIVRSLRPTFRWPERDAAVFKVSVFEGDRLFAESGTISTPQWTLTRDLSSGRSYVWQVEVLDHGRRFVIPSPAQPVARFLTLDQQSRDSLESAFRTSPQDHLLLAVLAARAGLKRDAERELALVSPTSAVYDDAERLRSSIRAWHVEVR
jgi:hypothetical protein